MECGGFVKGDNGNPKVTIAIGKDSSVDKTRRDGLVVVVAGVVVGGRGAGVLTIAGQRGSSRWVEDFCDGRQTRLRLT